MKNQKGALSLEHMGWLALILVMVTFVGSVFIPQIRSALVGVVNESNATQYSVNGLSCPKLSVPAKVNSLVNSVPINNYVQYNIDFNGTNYTGWRKSVDFTEQTYEVTTGTTTYICVKDADNNGLPDSGNN